MLHEDISKWIKEYAVTNDISTLVVGISGGIDSSVVSTLCARTGLPTIVLQMPIRQNKILDDRSLLHGRWLTSNYTNVKHFIIDLTPAFTAFEHTVGPFSASEQEPTPGEQLAWANSRSRLRMMTLYQVAQSHGGIVVGTGNKVEDFGVGFFTKYGDGGVDISPIGDCLKTEVWEMGRQLGVLQEIIDAPPTDGLWDDGRNDEDQLGMSYVELERAMSNDKASKYTKGVEHAHLEMYRKIRKRNLHKMNPIPVYKKS